MSDSSPPAYSFHGSNSSHSKDNGSGGRTYHIPNYATSYANDRSKLITIKFDEDRGTSKFFIVVIFLLFAAAPLSMLVVLRSSQAAGPYMGPLSGSSQPVVQNEWPPKAQVSTSKEDPWTQEKSQKTFAQAGTSPLSTTEGRAQAAERTNDKGHHAYWDKPRPGAQCSGFGTREYTARLLNFPFFSSWTHICRNTEIEIDGVLIPRPTYCEQKWPLGIILGHWVVNTKEDQCRAHWGDFADKGCIRKGSKIRRFQSRLWDIKAGEDWMTICSTAPAVIDGVEIEKPATCDNRGMWGIYGIWDVEDQNC